MAIDTTSPTPELRGAERPSYSISDGDIQRSRQIDAVLTADDTSDGTSRDADWAAAALRGQGLVGPLDPASRASLIQFVRAQERLLEAQAREVAEGEIVGEIGEVQAESKAIEAGAYGGQKPGFLGDPWFGGDAEGYYEGDSSGALDTDISAALGLSASDEPAAAADATGAYEEAAIDVPFEEVGERDGAGAAVAEGGVAGAASSEPERAASAEGESPASARAGGAADRNTDEPAASTGITQASVVAPPAPAPVRSGQDTEALAAGQPAATPETPRIVLPQGMQAALEAARAQGVEDAGFSHDTVSRGALFELAAANQGRMAEAATGIRMS